MNIFKRIIGHIYCLYALLLFAATLFIVVLPVLIANALYSRNEYKRASAVHTIYRIWMQVYMYMIFCPVYRKGAHHFAKGENYVVILNHNSFLDIPISSPWVPGANKTLAKSDFMKVPVFNIIYKSGSILVDRRSGESRKKSLYDMLDTLKKGIHLTLYPEGTRNKGEQPLNPFYDGAFRTALSAQKDIMIGVIFNTRKVLPSYPAFWGWPHRIRFEFLPPVPVKAFDRKDIEGLKNHCFNLMHDYYVRNK